MGGGNTEKQQGSRAAAESVSQAVAQSTGAVADLEPGAGSAERPFCARTHQVEYVATGSEAPRPGTPVTIRIGNPLRVLSEDAELGEVDSELNDALTRCLELGFSLRGFVQSLDAATRRGMLVITGEEDD